MHCLVNLIRIGEVYVAEDGKRVVTSQRTCGSHRCDFEGGLIYRMLWYGPRGKIDDSKYSKFYERKVCWGTSCAGSGGYIRIPRQKNCPGLSEAVHNSITDNSMKEPETILASSSGRRMEPHFSTFRLQAIVVCHYCQL